MFVGKRFRDLFLIRNGHDVIGRFAFHQLHLEAEHRVVRGLLRHPQKILLLNEEHVEYSLNRADILFAEEPLVLDGSLPEAGLLQIVLVVVLPIQHLVQLFLVENLAFREHVPQQLPVGKLKAVIEHLVDGLPEVICLLQLVALDQFRENWEIGLQLMEVGLPQLTDLRAELVHDQPLLRNIQSEAVHAELRDDLLLDLGSEPFVLLHLQMNLLDLACEVSVEVLGDARKSVDLLYEVDFILEEIVFSRDLRLVQLLQLIRSREYVD